MKCDLSRGAPGTLIKLSSSLIEEGGSWEVETKAEQSKFSYADDPY